MKTVTIYENGDMIDRDHLKTTILALMRKAVNGPREFWEKENNTIILDRLFSDAKIAQVQATPSLDFVGNITFFRGIMRGDHKHAWGTGDIARLVVEQGSGNQNCLPRILLYLSPVIAEPGKER